MRRCHGGRVRRSGAAGQAPSLLLIYRRLFRAFGPQGWWPATGVFEMMVGALLTQATSWRNVEQAIGTLREARALTPTGLLALRPRRLERLIRPSGYFRQKAVRLREFSRWYLQRYRGSPRRMFRTPWRRLREELLGVRRVGPETADSILLYAGEAPVFVVDAYTTRVLRRHRLIGGQATYEGVQQVAMAQLGRRSRLYNECHALLVAVGKQFCHRRAPACARCPLGDLPRTLEVTVDGNR